MNLHHLYYFQTVAQYKSFAKAANALFVSQPTLSYAISSLEKELNAKLFTRNGKAALLTDDGQVFLRYVDSSINQLEQGCALIGKQHDTSLNVIHVVSDRNNSVIAAFNQFRTSLPESGRDIQFTLHKTHVDQVEEQVITGKFEIGFMGTPPVEPGIEFVEFPDSPNVLCVPLKHPLAQQDSVNLFTVDWDNQQVIIRNMSGPTSRSRSIRALYSEAGFHIQNAASEVSSSYGMAYMIESGYGIGILPYFKHLSDYKLKILTIEKPKIDPVQYIICKKGTPLSLYADAFFQYFKEKYKSE